MVKINIDRATAENRTLLFDSAKGSYLFYNTIFGETVPIRRRDIPRGGISRTVLANDYRQSMIDYNNGNYGGDD